MLLVEDNLEVQEIVGRGGMGVVLRAFDEAVARLATRLQLGIGVRTTPAVAERIRSTVDFVVTSCLSVLCA